MSHVTTVLNTRATTANHHISCVRIRTYEFLVVSRGELKVLQWD